MTDETFSQRERLSWLRLARTPRIGPITFDQLMQRFGSAEAALEALPSLPRSGRHLQIPTQAEAEDELSKIERLGAKLVCAGEAAYPALLAQLTPPPPVLTLKGHITLSQRPSIAIVGARNASAAGLRLARDMAAILGAADFTIVSGLARGIDKAAHLASLESGTVAVLAGGLDHVYPPQNADLYHEIGERGLLVSENPIGMMAQAHDFPRRNRIVTGLAYGVVIVEAAERSGSLISARFAGEQGREVMAVPGSPLDPRAAGNNHLIREGATLVRKAEDVLEVLRHIRAPGLEAPEPRYVRAAGTEGPIPDRQLEAVRQVLSPTPMPLDDIAKAAELGAARCAAILMELELAGIAQTFAGGSASLVVPAP